jgi:ADP-ribosyltransferase exoenzyme
MRIIRRITEDLNQVAADPGGKASQQAKRKNLIYVGFGRYVDPKSKQVTHIVMNDELVPFNQAVRTNTFQQQGQDDVGQLGAAFEPATEEIHNILSAHYAKTKYDNRELDAIQHFTDLGHIDINHRLSQLPSGVLSHKIERQTPDDYLPDVIGSLDSAIKKSRAPMDFIAYTKLHDDTDVSQLVPGSTFKFKSFRNTSIHLPTVLNSSQPTKMSPEGRPMVSLLQLNIKKHSRGLYASDYSTTPQDREFILPRGAQVKIIDHPKTVIGSDATSGTTNLQMQYYNAEVKG